MRVESLIKVIGSEFYTGIPDSYLRPLCDYLMNTYGINVHHHVIAANEGNCTALAAGYYLATGKIPVVYMQNSGEGNIVNPMASLLNDKVYAIPIVFIIGWRGEPGSHDEPQHLLQGEITVKLMENMNIETFIIKKETTEEELRNVMSQFKKTLSIGKSVSFVIRKGALSYDKKMKYENKNTMLREKVIKHILKISMNNPIVSTTGKTSRELFDIRTTNEQSHEYDFLTVGSMGHSSTIALGIAINKPNTKIWCIDGDGAILMHMGSMAVIGANAPKNLIHVVINNSAHESVGGMPTVGNKIDLVGIAMACGYPYAVSVDTFEKLDEELKIVKKHDTLSLIEVKCSVGSRSDLGRPTIMTLESKKNFMAYLKKID